MEFATRYIVRPYLKVKSGDDTTIMYGNTNMPESYGFNIGSSIDERTGNSITKSIRINNLSEIPSDVTIEEVGLYWEEWNENGRTSFEDLPAENKASGALDSNGEFKVTATNLKEGVKYWISFYIKFNGKINKYEWWEETTATLPKVEDNQSPEKKYAVNFPNASVNGSDR